MSLKRSTITFWRIVHTGMVNFMRNITLAVAAMAVMVVTLTIVLFSIIANASFANTIAQITDKIDVSVFLSDTTTDAQAAQLVSQLRHLPEVRSVQYLDKTAALKAYQRTLASNQKALAAVSAANNPIPATIHIKPYDLNKINAIKDFLTKPANQALQTEGSPSYSGDRKAAIDKITHATNALQRVGVISVVVFAVICALIIFNTIQMAIFNRRDEITIMRLLGAKTSYIRGPFIVETIIYGVLAAFASIFIINAAFVAANRSLQATSLGLFDINYAAGYFNQHFLWLLTIQVGIGIVIGTASSTIATRRYLKFKIR